jgi:hypothetical protein
VASTHIKSIFGVGDWRSDFFSEFPPLLTAWQSEQGCAPSNVRTIAVHNDCCFAYDTIMVVQAIDCNATQCNPIAQQSALIVAIRPTQRNTMAKLVGVPVRVNKGMSA